MNKKILYLLVLSSSALLGSIGQLFFKYSLILLGTAFDYGSIMMLLGLISYGISTIIYFYILSRVHLSWAYSVSGISYIVAVILSKLILLENVTYLRWAGVILIFIGVVLVSYT